MYTLNHFIDELIQKRKNYRDYFYLIILINLCAYHMCVCT